jgi:hypothetical protein
MLKRFALLGSMAVLTIGSASSADAAVFAAAAAAVASASGPGFVETVQYYPSQYYPSHCCLPPRPPRPILCCHRPRPIICCVRPRPWCCNAGYGGYAGYGGRPPYFYGDNFAPYAYNPYRYDAGYDGYGDYGYGDDGTW